MRAPAWVCAGLATLAASACASDEPVALSSSFASHGGLPWTTYPMKGKSAPPPPCRISIGEVVDARSDTKSMGSFGGRQVTQEDSVGWVRSGLDTLGKDRRFTIVATPDVGDGFVLNVTLLKAYLQGLAVAKNATVVLRINYARVGAQADEKVYRGDITDMNWASGDGEARDALNFALRQALTAVNSDLRARCDKLSLAAAALQHTPEIVAPN